MVQVRCPECGYVQTLSEERFMSISEDFLNCPHCAAKVPKEWRPAEGESVPEEAGHKMLAFSRRILNGRHVAREVVYALESLVRHYGSTEDSDKALGVGYTILGEHKKAEEFLESAVRADPDDAQVLGALLEGYLAQERAVEATEVGERLMEILGPHAQDEDLARLALAYIRAGESERAGRLLDSFPDVDQGNPLVKQARKELNKAGRGGVRALLGEIGKLGSFLRRPKARRPEPIPPRPEGASDRPTPPATDAKGPAVEPGPAASPAKASVMRTPKLPALAEYWVYSTQSEIPRWDDIRHKLAQLLSVREEREKAFNFLESLLEKEDLAIEYILKRDAQELFDYPEEMIPHNSRDFSDDDRRTLLDAQLIVRVRLIVDGPWPEGYLTFMAQFVEAVRSLAGGVVQDAVSHALWGSGQWSKLMDGNQDTNIAYHLQFETLEEGDGVWIHSHGMQKYALPDLEIDGAPAESATAAGRLMRAIADRLVAAKTRGERLVTMVEIPGSPVRVAMEFRAPDEEGHFPVGSLRLLPHLRSDDPHDSGALARALEALISGPPRPKEEAVAPAAPAAQEAPAPAAEADKPDSQELLRQRLLDAHKKARETLSGFKKSFQSRKDSHGPVHAVKVGFPVHGGSYEWMWISLGAWRGDNLVGHVENKPVLRKDLREGSVVHFSEGEIFDWLIMDKGNVSQGAYTEGIIP